MAADLNRLIPPFKEKVQPLLAGCLRDGFDMRPFFTERDVWIQARLWRQSRTTQQIHEAARKLARAGAPFLREVLLSVGPQEGRWATNALPGQSWHQWGEAVDCFVQEAGSAIWRRSHPGYLHYAEKARDLGLEAGYFWRNQDAVHVQFSAGKVLDRFSWEEIDERMRERYAPAPDPVTPVTGPDAPDVLPDLTTVDALASLSTEDLVVVAEQSAAELERRRTR